MSSHTLLGSCALMDIRTSQAMHHLKTLLDTLQLTSRMLTCCLDPDLVTVPEKSTLFSYFGLWKVPELVEAQFPFGSGAVDSWPAISGRPEHKLRWTHWSYGVEVLCGFTDGEHEIRKPMHTRTDDDLETVQMIDTETRKVIAMMLVILEKMSRKFVYSRRMKDLRELEAQHEATVSESATDDQKFRMHSEYKAVCLTDQTRSWLMEHSDQQAEHLREMHVRDSESDRIARQCSGDEGSLCTDLVESKNVFDTSPFKLCDPESNLRESKIKCMLVEFEQQAGYEFGMSHNVVMQIPQESLVLVSLRVASHSISGIPLDALSVLDNSFLSDESGNLLNMILDSGAEGHSGFWAVWSLGRHDENSVCVRGSSLFALKSHDAFDDGAKWILQADEPRTQWESVTSCCRMLGWRRQRSSQSLWNFSLGQEFC